MSFGLGSSDSEEVRTLTILLGMVADADTLTVFTESNDLQYLIDADTLTVFTESKYLQYLIARVLINNFYFHSLY